MISLRTHNILDYVGGGLLILSPFLFGFAELDSARNVFILSGFFLILYSLFTNYKYSVLRVIPIGTHMTMDVIMGTLIFIAPWMLDYRAFLTPGQEYLHYALGLGVFALVGFTEEKSEAERRAHRVTMKTSHLAR